MLSTLMSNEENNQEEVENEYSSHEDQLRDSQPPAERVEAVQDALLKAYADVIVIREVPFIVFGDLSAEELARAFINFPLIIKPTLCCVNVAQRAIKKELGFDFNTYGTRITEAQAHLLAGYLVRILPPAIAVPALMELDRYAWVDKMMRASKGNWEKAVTKAINEITTSTFKKRKFVCDDETFEIDAANPPKGEPIEVAIDVKRIESPRDIHKRADEIINKAAKFKKVYPSGKFVAVVYYPFPTQHINATNRLKSPHIDYVFFAAATESSIKATADMIVGTLCLERKA